MSLATHLFRYANAALEGCWLVLAALVPLYFDLLRSQPGTPKGLLLQIVVVLMALLWLVQRAAATRLGEAAEPAPAAPGLPRWLFGLAVAYAATTLLSALLSPLPALAFWGSYLRNDGAIATLCYVVLFLVVADRLRSRAQFERLVTVLLAAALPVCLYGLAQGLRLDPLPWERDLSARVVSTAGNALFLAAYLVLVLPLALYRLLGVIRREETDGGGTWSGAVVLGVCVVALALVFSLGATRTQAWWTMPALLAAYALLATTLPPLPGTPVGQRVRVLAYGALLALALIVLLLTASIGPLGALFLAPLLLAALVFARERRVRPLLALGSAALLALVMFVALAAPNSPLDPLKARVTLLQRIGAVGAGGVGPRGVIWQVSIPALAEQVSLDFTPDSLGPLRPLIGYGPETIAFLLNRVLPPPERLDFVLGEFWDRSHNALIDRLLTTGLLGLASYVALLLGILLVALRRALPGLDARRVDPYVALVLAVLIHVLEIQFSMLILPAAAIFWLLAGAAVGARWDLAAAPAPEAVAQPTAARQSRAARRGRATPRPVRAADGETLAWLPLAAYGGLMLLFSLLLLATPPLNEVLAATVVSLVLLACTPFVAAPHLLDSPSPARAPATLALLAVPAIAATLLLSTHQVHALGADVWFKRAEGAHASQDYGGAIASTQQALRLAPDQPEYYFVLGQYFAALGGGTRNLPVAGFEPSLQEALNTGRATLLGRDQLFRLGQVMLEEAIRLLPNEARYYFTLGELHRYWAEVANEPSHLAAALAAFQRAAYLKPNDVEIHVGIADTLLLRQDPARAAEVGQHARRLLPSYWYPYSVLARAYHMMGWEEAAYDTAQDALQAARDRGLGRVKTATRFDLERLEEVVEATRDAAT